MAPRPQSFSQECLFLQNKRFAFLSVLHCFSWLFSSTSMALIYTYGWLHTFRSDLLSILLDILLNKYLLNYLVLNRCPTNTLLLQI